MWSDALGQAIREQSDSHYKMELTPTDAQCVTNAVNQGIDSYLQACYLPARGDEYKQVGNRLMCKVSPESLPVLVRRMMESGDENAESLASSICETLDIELI